MNRTKRLLSVMLLTCGMATGAWALDTDTDGYYLIGSVQDWQDFAALVETTPTANARMTADINLGDDQTVIATTYSGTFDGQKHTLTFNLTATKSGYGLFCTLGDATIKNLHVTGTVTTSYDYTGGIVGCIQEYKTGTLTNCRSSVTMHASSSAEDTGGFVGQVDYHSTFSINDCLFDGSFDGAQSSDWGGFIGHNYYAYVTISNSLFAPTSINIKDGLSTFGSNPTNCFTSVSGNTTQGVLVTAEQLSDGTTAAALQNNREETVWVQDPLTNQPMLALFAGKYTVPTSGVGTFSAKANFTLPDGLTAYYCKNYDATDGTISVTAIEGTVPAETGVLLKGTAGETYTLTISDETPATVTDIERGAGNPSMKTVARILEVLGLEMQFRIRQTT